MQSKVMTVLLVEDNPDHAELVRRNLQHFPLTNRLVHLEDGEKAMEYLRGHNGYADRSQHPCPDLVLLDLRLPRMDGLQVLQEIKTDANLQCIPVVILTTSDAERDVAQAYRHHANSYLNKPVDFQSFAKLMQDFGLYWLGWNKPL